MAERLLIPILLVLLVVTHVALASIVEETCAKVENMSLRKELEAVCVTTLQAAPGSATADTHGLAVIATNLTLVNYTAAVATIKDLQRHGGWTDGQQAALATCRERYTEALNAMHSAVHALAMGQKRAYEDNMVAARRASTDCTAASVAADKEKSPLRKVNADAEHLTVVAMVIFFMLYL
ncbi:uncharacterized protein [Lolium perenne]|uniref:uncharacterized protein n=1 Tax=Lolium perenne TaxID=4522 RepID=UPI0021F5D683|nr:uncharacterized protein LOC127326024 [Lolium perenne]